MRPPGIRTRSRSPNDVRVNHQSSVLFAVPFPANTGRAWDRLERLVASLSTRLAEQGYRCIVGYPEIPSPPVALEGAPVTVVAVPALGRGDAASLRALLPTVRRHQVEHLVLIDLPYLSSWFLPLRAAGVRSITVHVISSGRGTPPRGAKHWLKHRIARSPLAADLLICCSHFRAQEVMEVGLVPADRVRTVWNGVDLPEQLDRSRCEMVKRFSLPEEAPVIVAVARAAPEKGIRYLLEGFDRLSARWNGSPPPSLLYIGNGPELDSLLALRDSLPSGSRMHLPGYVPDAMAVCSGADVFVQPSVSEDAFPYSVVEAMAWGVPVVGTRTGGIPEQVDHETTGLLVPPHDPDGIATALERLLGDEAFRRSAGAAGRERVREHFTLQRQLRAMSEALEESLGARPA